MGSLQPAASRLAVVSNAIDEKKHSKKERIYPRVSVRLSDELKGAIDDIIEKTEATSPSQVMRSALVVYHTLVHQTLAGNQSGVMMKNGDFVPVFTADDITNSVRE